MIYRCWLLVVFALLTAGCLTTRAELREVEAKRTTQVSAVQERQAQATARFDEYDQQFRSLNGRLDVVENQLTQINAGHADRQNLDQQKRDELERRLLAYEEAIKKLDQQVQSLKEEVKNNRSTKASSASGGTGSTKESYQSAESAFDKKDFKQAIIDYEAYRKNNPKGKNYAAATLKIGMSFHELNMKDEARAFYEEVVAKFPSSKEAKKASQRLKTMK